MSRSISIELPAWLAEAQPPAGACTPADDEARMHWVVGLARANVAHGGGPFAAAVFETGSGRLVSLGVNLVMPLNCSVLHAEIVALVLAQQALGCHSLRLAPGAGYELLSSTEPCAMCLGALPWAGVGRLVCGARDEDARAAGFDEGDKPADWVGGLVTRGIAVARDVGREAAAAVLREYAAAGRPLYNG